MKRFKKPLLFLSLFLVTAFVIDLVYLNHLINRRIREGLLKIPSSIFGRKIELREEENIYNRFLFNYLETLDYGEIEGEPLRGEYSRKRGLIRIYLKDVRDGETIHKGFPATISYDEERGDIHTIETGDIPLDALVLGIPEVGKVADRKKEIRDFISLEDLPRHLIEAVLAAEDRRFFSHIGLDYRAIARAFLKNFATMSFREGGSTITQQLARNFFLSFEKTLVRKCQETLIALMLELKYRKEKILELYLNQIYLGQRGSEGIYGVGEASIHYFGKNAGELDLSESVMIASLIKSPNYYSPLRHPERIFARMSYVVDGMVTMGTLTRELGQEVLKSLPPLYLDREEKSSSTYFTDTILETLSEKMNEKEILYGGYRIYTTLDPVIQDIASKSLTSVLPGIERRYGLEKPLQGAVVILDNKRGEILALVGGRSYGKSQFNRATMARRQVGSLFKPFVVFSALRSGIEGKPVTLSTEIDGNDISIDTREGPWVPGNFENRKYGAVTVRNILENSINTGAVRLGLGAGLENIVRISQSFGLGKGLKAYPSLILGAFSFSPLEMAYAYAVFSSGGLKYPIRLVRNVYGEKKKILQYPHFPIRVIEEEEAFLIMHALTGAVDRGTGKALGKIFPGQVAGKTGTTDEGRDSWFVGITREYTICVWVGFDDAAPSPLTGATGALPVCGDILKKLYRGSSPREIDAPSGITIRKIDYHTGFLATSGCDVVIDEAYLAGTEPRRFCPDHPPGPVEKLGTKIFDAIRKLFNSGGP